jgi:hypothetical protein
MQVDALGHQGGQLIPIAREAVIAMRPGASSKEVPVSRFGDLYEHKVTGERAVVLRGDEDGHGNGPC